MSETAVAAGGESLADFEAVFNVNQAQLDEILTSQQYYDFWLGQTFSKSPDYEIHRKRAIEHVDAVFDVLGLNQTAMVESFQSVRDPGVWNPITQKELQCALEREESIGHVLYNRAFWSFDIEGNEAGYGVMNMHFALRDGRELSLLAHGDFWTERTYVHPQTKEPFYPNETQVLKIEEALQTELEVLDSSVDYQLNFEGRIELPRRENDNQSTNEIA